MSASTPPAPPRWRVRFQLYLTAVLALLALVAGSAVSWLNYRSASSQLIDSHVTQFDYAVSAAESRTEHLLAPVDATLQMLGGSALVTAGSLAARLEALPLLIRALRQDQRLSALYLGYPDGEFFLLRPLDSPDSRRLFTAPPDSRYLVQGIDQQDGQRWMQFVYLDEAGRVLYRQRLLSPPFDPRTRGWYQSAVRAAGQRILTEPYRFYTTGEAGASVAREIAPGVVAGADLSLQDLSRWLVRQPRISRSEIVLYDATSLRLLASSLPPQPDRHGLALPELGNQGSAAMAALARGPHPLGAYPVEVDGEPWRVVVRALPQTSHGPPLRLAVLVPEDELLAAARAEGARALLLTGILVLVVVPLAWWIAGRVSASLVELAGRARAIHALDFSPRPPLHSAIREIDTLAQSMDGMQATIGHFLAIGLALMREREPHALYDRLLAETLAAAEGAAVGLYFLDADRRQLLPAGGLIGEQRLILPALSLRSSLHDARARALETGRSQIEPLQPDSPVFDGLPPPVMALGRQGPSIRLCVPLVGHEGRGTGVLVLLFVHGQSLSHERQAFIEALAGLAAVAIDNQQLLSAQTALLDSLIRLLAGAIDAKSPHTGGHCQRVPVLLRWLAEAACEARQGPFASFRLTPGQWDALLIAGWLHDCGKVTTPEYVVDKATKLETLYDRIHEIRTRFEVLKRDADIDYWRGVAAGGDAAALGRTRDERHAALDADFAFVAACNTGERPLSDADLARLRRIGARTWQRTLDDRLGISHEEQSRLPAAGPLPATEPLLADKPGHRVPRPDGDGTAANRRRGFSMEAPDWLYDRGELHNLSVRVGTLTAEERYKINEHIIQTIEMLRQLPFPPHLKQVPDIAGSHHEHVDGSGYPRGLMQDDMSVEARMLAIADVFEALTAADRPYKTGQPVSEALARMRAMCERGHLDRDLFVLFVESGVWRRYAERYLAPAQLDAVDVAAVLAPPGDRTPATLR